VHPSSNATWLTIPVEEPKYSVRLFYKTVCVIPLTRGRMGGVVFRIDFRISGCWRTAREAGAWPSASGFGLPSK
jgi:hypothetical protein